MSFNIAIDNIYNVSFEWNLSGIRATEGEVTVVYAELGDAAAKYL